MLSQTVRKKLKKVLNPNRFRVVIILYNNTNDIDMIKNHIKEEFRSSNHHNFENDTSYDKQTAILYKDNSFIFIDSFSDFLEKKELVSAFNQRRDKLSKYAINLIFFYPKALQDKLYKDALNLIPDFWEFRTAVIELEGEKEGIKDIEIKESRSFIEYSGMNQEEKLKEIDRLSKKLEESDDELFKASLLDDLGFLYEELGEYEKAKPFYEKSLKIREDVLGENHSDTATSYNNLAELYKTLGEYEKAKPLYEKSMKILEEVLGENHLVVALSYNNLALLYKHLGEYEKAKLLYEKSLQIREEVLGENHPDTAASYSNLAGVYNSLGEYEKARQLYEKSLKISEEVLGEKHPDTATSYNNLALLYKSLGEYEKAKSLLEKSLKISEEVLGENHPATATIYNNLGLLYLELKECSKAEEFLKKSVEILEQLDFSHPDLLETKEALKFIQDTIKKQKKATSKDKGRYCKDI